MIAKLAWSALIIGFFVAAFPWARPLGAQALAESSNPLSDLQVIYVGKDHNIHLFDLSSGADTALTFDGTADERYAHPKFAPNGVDYAYYRYNNDPATRSAKLVLASLEHTEVRVLADDAYRGYDWSPSGDQIVHGRRTFRYNLGEDASAGTWIGESGIWAVDIESGIQRELIPSINQNPLINPIWSPDGMWLLFEEVVYIEGRGNWLLRNSADGTITDLPIPGKPSWSSDSSSIVYDEINYAGRPGMGIYTISPHTPAVASFVFSEPHQVASNPVYSPNGEWIAFGVGEPESPESQLILVHIASGNATDTGSAAFYPLGWSPDGEKILVVQPQPGSDWGSRLAVYSIADNSTVVLPVDALPDASWRPTVSTAVNDPGVPAADDVGSSVADDTVSLSPREQAEFIIVEPPLTYRGAIYQVAFSSKNSTPQVDSSVFFSPDSRYLDQFAQLGIEELAVLRDGEIIDDIGEIHTILHLYVAAFRMYNPPSISHEDVESIAQQIADVTGSTLLQMTELGTRLEDPETTARQTIRSLIMSASPKPSPESAGELPTVLETGLVSLDTQDTVDKLLRYAAIFDDRPGALSAVHVDVVESVKAELALVTESWPGIRDAFITEQLPLIDQRSPSQIDIAVTAYALMQPQMPAVVRYLAAPYWANGSGLDATIGRLATGADEIYGHFLVAADANRLRESFSIARKSIEEAALHDVDAAIYDGDLAKEYGIALSLEIAALNQVRRSYADGLEAAVEQGIWSPINLVRSVGDWGRLFRLGSEQETVSNIRNMAAASELEFDLRFADRPSMEAMTQLALATVDSGIHSIVQASTIEPTVVTNRSQPTATVTPAPTPTLAEMRSAPASTPEPTMTPSSIVAQVLVPLLNMRAGPSTEFAVVDQIEEGTRIIPLGRNGSGDWVQVETPASTVGWVSAEFLDLPQPVFRLEEIASPSVPTSVPVVACQLATAGRFLTTWDQTVMGCPLGNLRTVWAAWQSFERGHMLWREDQRDIYILYAGGSWETFDDDWPGSADPIHRGAPPTGLQAPVRGFGFLWGGNESVYQSLGWAVQKEMGTCAVMQEFEHGFILEAAGSSGCAQNSATHGFGAAQDQKTVTLLSSNVWRW